MQIGQTLRSAREARGFSLADVELKTKIRKKYLVAMEKEDFSLLPGRVYAKGFIRTYARFLELDDDSLVREFNESFPSTDREVEKVVESISRTYNRSGRGWYKAFVALVAVGMLALFIYIPNIQRSPPVRDETGSGQQEPQANNQGENNPSRPWEVAEEKTVNGVDLILRVTDDRCWMRVEVDGQPAFTGTVPAGDMKRFTGNDKIFVRLGNPPVVQVMVNGENIGVLSNSGDPVNREFMANNG